MDHVRHHMCYYQELNRGGCHTSYILVEAVMIHFAYVTIKQLNSASLRIHYATNTLVKVLVAVIRAIT